ncbi:MAG: hypothetical protein LBP22_08695 [Deltaproteobacteria bacterium]|nr:hypothetical protein [Deltaproteobacteria bacterium]
MNCAGVRLRHHRQPDMSKFSGLFGEFYSHCNPAFLFCPSPWFFFLKTASKRLICCLN